ncbi:hypothetical protein [Devosia sp. SD17-2]|jgi:hypothetical protein|uniref:hypothetical protein n=1 Tax=Devosia sp. SD17-2 TaxID=2976459 RepID=UPI0023D8A653|nr:hypothetical protein [Devosia sp. SD17-2]WEJ34481.1 hypothetical protein NYQ88_06660 [Devosia sp. SD17-2]
MQPSKAIPRRKKVRLAVALGSSVACLGAASIALLGGVTPAVAANIASQPDAQIAVFMVPLTLLLMVMLFEAARFIWRGRIPVQTPAKRSLKTHWQGRN